MAAACAAISFRLSRVPSVSRRRASSSTDTPLRRACNFSRSATSPSSSRMMMVAMISMLPHDHVDQRWAPLLHYAQGAAQRRPDGGRRLDGALGVYAEALGEPREVRRGVVDADAADLVPDRPPPRLPPAPPFPLPLAHL